MFGKIAATTVLWPWLGLAADRHNILDYAPIGTQVDRTGAVDASPALTAAVNEANTKTSRGEPACIYLPAGTYRIVSPPPAFERAGCVIGDGPSQTILRIDPRFEGDLFAWSEAWVVTTPGPMVAGLTVQGDKSATTIQNAFVFYDRNDEVYIENVDVKYLHGRALYSGVTKHADRAYMRESHMRSLRFFEDGTPGVPAVEFNSQGSGNTDATNEIRMSQVDIYGSRGPGFVIRNNGSGGVRNITVDALRIEGLKSGTTRGDLLTIGDPIMKGNVNNITITNLELIDPSKGYAALRLTAAPGVTAPYQITVQGAIGGGMPAGQGLRIEAGRTSVFRLTGIHTMDTNVLIGPNVTGILLDGGDQEAGWTYSLHPSSLGAIHAPVLRAIDPTVQRIRRKMHD